MQWITARRALEVEVVGECAQRLPGPVIGQLHRNLLYQQAAVGGNDYAGFLQLDVAFHQAFTDGLDLHRVGELLDSLRSHLDRVRRLLLPEPGRMECTLAEHRAVAEAIARRRPRQAQEAMRSHVNVVLDRLISFERLHPDFFGQE